MKHSGEHREIEAATSHELRLACAEAVGRAEVSGLPQLLAARIELSGIDPLAIYSAWDRASSGERACDQATLDQATSDQAAGHQAASAHAALEDQDRFFWEQPQQHRALAARGCVCSVECDGEQRFDDSAAEVRAHFARLTWVGDAPRPDEGALFVGGFAFDSARPLPGGEWVGFPTGRLTLPELQLVRDGERAWCVVAREVRPESEPEQLALTFEREFDQARRFEGRFWHETDDASDEDEWAGEDGAEYLVVADRAHRVYRQQVRDALDSAEEGEFEKVVLARSLEVRHPGRFALPRFLDRLRELYPTCTIQAVGRGRRTLVAASPERLVSLRDDLVATGALAGSAARGRSPEEDDRLGVALRESKKDQSEHEAVVRAIRGALGEVCSSLDGPETPELMKVEGIQHLHTPLVGRLVQSIGRAAPGAESTGVPPIGVLELIQLLHPTPAVGGLPHESALAWLREHEGLDRGWYAGPVGWVDASGCGEFWLALRSALLENPRQGAARDTTSMARARLFAGAGIVRGSDPELELRETRLKLRALLAPLTEI